MSKLFQLRHLDGAPLLSPLSSEEPGRKLGESIRHLDAEPVIVVDLDHGSFDDSVDACKEMLFEKRSDAALVVIDPNHTISVLLGLDGPSGVKVVDSVIAAAVNAHRIAYLSRRRGEREAAKPRRFRVRQSIM